mmetsp:Transcript_50185/g.122456  ORF Transcript_50185/g.122456 Transcript_50185/m.122456 type:complete len:293 (-) Transcript_50185:1156-2034(-)
MQTHPMRRNTPKKPAGPPKQHQKATQTHVWGGAASWRTRPVADGQRVTRGRRPCCSGHHAVGLRPGRLGEAVVACALALDARGAARLLPRARGLRRLPRVLDTLLELLLPGRHRLRAALDLAPAGRGRAPRRRGGGGVLLGEVVALALDEVLDRRAVGVDVGAVGREVREARHAEPVAHQRLPRVLARRGLVRDLLPTPRLLVHRVGLHEAPAEARPAVGAGTARRHDVGALEAGGDAHGSVDLAAVPQERHLEVGDARHVPEHHGQAPSGLGERGVEKRVVRDLLHGVVPD